MLDKQSAVPLYLQLKEHFIHLIESGELKEAARLPSEREICTEFGVSRLTVRQALAELAREGRTSTAVGKGTYVAERKLDQQLQTLTGFSEDMRNQGKVASSQVLEALLIPAPATLAELLQVEPGATIVRLERLRLADDVPMAIETAHLPHLLCPGLLQFDLEKRSLYEILRQEYGLSLCVARQTFQVSLSTPREMEQLGLTVQAPMLLTERVTYLKEGVPIECVRSVYRGDRYKVHTILRCDV